MKTINDLRVELCPKEALRRFKFVKTDRKYSREMVETMISRFISQGLKLKDIDLYLDMDNNLFLFSPFGDAEVVSRMMNYGYFRYLQPLDSATEVVPKLIDMGVNVYILSACIPRNGDGGKSVMEEKDASLDEYFPMIPKENRIYCLTGQNKSHFVRDIKKSILVDDYGPNLKDWIDAGGFAIKKTSAGILTDGKKKQRNIPHIKNFYELFYLFYQLGLY